MSFNRLIQLAKSRHPLLFCVITTSRSQLENRNLTTTDVLLFQYFLAIMLVLVGECVVYLVTWAWPTCLGLNLGGEELTKSLQRNYGVAGQEQFTVAIDLAQTLVSGVLLETMTQQFHWL